MSRVANANSAHINPLAKVAWFTLLVAALALPIGFGGGESYRRVDSEWYVLIAQGRTAAAMQPFTARQLGPLLARGCSAITHASLLHSFLIIGVGSLLVTAFLVAIMLVRSGAGNFAALAVAAMYFWPALFGAFMLPDTLSAALLACFLYCLFRHWWYAAALLLLPMFVARESTILVLLCFLLTGWRRLRSAPLLTAVISSIAGLAIVRVLSAHAATNREQLNPLVYMAGKVPWNFSANVLGVGPWMPSLTGFCSTPNATFTLPFGVHIGGSTQLGLCAWSPALQLHTLLLALCSFGLFPLLAVYLWRRYRSAFFTNDLFLRFCIVYGALSFLAAPTLGHTVERLSMYGWPIFLLAVPIVGSRVFSVPLHRTDWSILLVLHLALSWLNVYLFPAREQRNLPLSLLLTAAVLVVYVGGWILLRHADSRRTPPAAGPEVAA